MKPGEDLALRLTAALQALEAEPLNPAHGGGGFGDHACGAQGLDKSGRLRAHGHHASSRWIGGRRPLYDAGDIAAPKSSGAVRQWRAAEAIL